MNQEPIAIHYPYNESFHFYGEPRAGKRAQQFVDKQNQLLGGTGCCTRSYSMTSGMPEKGEPRRISVSCGLPPLI